MIKDRKVVSLRSVEKPPESPITHFTVSVYLKNDKVTIENVKLIEVNAQAGLLVVSGARWTKVYPIPNIEWYEFIEHREVSL